MPESGISAPDALKYLLSDSAASLRELLAKEADVAADLLVRQALRKSVPLVAAALPQPPQLPFLPSLPEPLTLPLPLLVPDGASAASARPVLTTGQAALDAVAPALSRDEELYAISLVDFAKSALGEEAAALIAGDLAQDPAAAARTAVPLVRPLLSSAREAAPAEGPSSPLIQLATTAVDLLAQLPTSSPAGGRAGAEEHSAGAAAIEDAVASLSEAERETLSAVLDELAGSLRAKLDERILTLR